MAKVVLDHLDPSLSYFSDVGFRYEESYQQPDLWSRRRRRDGRRDLPPVRRGTEVFVEIATSRDTALRCGETTGHLCDSIRFMDGNRMRVSRSSTVAEGLEVQYRPNGARSSRSSPGTEGTGKMLDLDAADLHELIEDPRLKLPGLADRIRLACYAARSVGSTATLPEPRMQRSRAGQIRLVHVGPHRPVDQEGNDRQDRDQDDAEGYAHDRQHGSCPCHSLPLIGCELHASDLGNP